MGGVGGTRGRIHETSCSVVISARREWPSRRGFCSAVSKAMVICVPQIGSMKMGTFLRLNRCKRCQVANSISASRARVDSRCQRRHALRYRATVHWQPLRWPSRIPAVGRTQCGCQKSRPFADKSLCNFDHAIQNRCRHLAKRNPREGAFRFVWR
jgi:hypothetical protein